MALMVSMILDERLKLYQQLIEAVKTKCTECDILKGMQASGEYIYEVYDEYTSEYTTLAIAQYNDCSTYAVYAPDNLSDVDETDIFSIFMMKVQKYASKDERIIVFSKKSYDVFKKIARQFGLPVNIILYEK